MGFRPNNRKSGNAFEEQLCKVLFEKGFWCHRLMQSAAGQPFDILAARNGKTFPIDCKVCERDVFDLSRIEPNQFTAMLLWQDTGNPSAWFALQLSDKSIYMVSYAQLMVVSMKKTTLNKEDIKLHGLPLDEWIWKR